MEWREILMARREGMVEEMRAGWRITHDVTALRKKGEDAHAVRIVDVGDETLLLALVADGHGGARASSTLAEQLLPKVIEVAENTSTAGLEAAMARAFAILHAEIRKTGTEGSTATVVAIALKQGTITCGNVGDSFAYGFSHGPTDADKHLIHLSSSHRLQEQGERTSEARRVEAAGGVVAPAVNQRTGGPSGPLRAWPGGLAMARALGDADCGEWLLPVPSTYSCELPRDGCDVLLASDGVWDALSLRTVYGLVERWPAVSHSVKDVVDAAISAKGLHDDTTALLLRLEPAGTFKAPTSPTPQPHRRLSVNKLFGGKPYSEMLTKPNSWHEEYAEGNLPSVSVKAGTLFRPFTQMTQALRDLEPDTSTCTDSTSSVSELEMLDLTTARGISSELDTDTLSPLRASARRPRSQTAPEIPPLSFSQAALARTTSPDERGPSLTERSDRSVSERSRPGRHSYSWARDAPQNS